MDDLQLDALKNEAYNLGKNDAWNGGTFARTFLTLFDYLGVGLDCMSEGEAGIIWDCYNEGFDETSLAASYEDDNIPIIVHVVEYCIDGVVTALVFILGG